ncbi:MAG: zinc ribbon domain-containing protein [Ktedonobacteraceae bacterium]|nr:zinc ribbon domain-containing protein [Ktedonobacteraceae bacterium]
MPVYEYVCPECRTHVEHIRLMKEADDPTPCPRCSHLVVRQVSRFAFKKTAVVSDPTVSKPVHMSACACCSPGRG